MTPLLISFSGGKTSALMSVMLSDYFAARERVVVFANTGLELPETLDYVRDCSEHYGLNVVWVEAVIKPEKGQGTRHKVVNYETASRNGEPLCRLSACCTRELKRRAVHSFVRNELGWTDYETAIGVRYDERHRINRQDAEREQWIYPLSMNSQPCSKTCQTSKPIVFVNHRAKPQVL